MASCHQIGTAVGGDYVYLARTLVHYCYLRRLPSKGLLAVKLANEEVKKNLEAAAELKRLFVNTFDKRNYKFTVSFSGEMEKKKK